MRKVGAILLRLLGAYFVVVAGLAFVTGHLAASLITILTVKGAWAFASQLDPSVRLDPRRTRA